jgi:hypothetical protein
LPARHPIPSQHTYARTLSAVTILALVSVCGSPVAAVTTKDEACEKIVAAIIYNEIQAAPNQGRWMYQAEYQKDGHHYLATRIDTNDGVLYRVLQRDYKPLTPAEESTEKARLDSLVSSPSSLAKNKRDSAEDDRKTSSIFAILPQTSLFYFEKRDANLGTIKFHPNPAYSPSGIESKVVAGMEGAMTVDLNKMRLLSIDGVEAKDVTFFLGLGKIHQGSTIQLKRMEIAPGIWGTSNYAIHMNGQVLFLKSFNQEGQETRTKFTRVAPDLSARQALQIILNRT